MAERVVITGYGTINPVGNTVSEYSTALKKTELVVSILFRHLILITLLGLLPRLRMPIFRIF